MCLGGEGIYTIQGPQAKLRLLLNDIGKQIQEAGILLFLIYILQSSREARISFDFSKWNKSENIQTRLCECAFEDSHLPLLTWWKKDPKTLNLLLTTSKKPDRCSSSPPMPSAPTSLPSLAQLSFISNPCNSFVLQDKNSILSNWENQQHNAQSLAVSYVPRACKRRKRTIYPAICHSHFHFCEALILVVWSAVTSQNHDMKIFTTVTWIGRRYFQIASSSCIFFLLLKSSMVWL